MKARNLFLAVCLVTILLPSSVSATDTSLQLRILPIDCVFEVVNDGSNELRYLTPEACGQIIPPPDTNPPASNEGSINTQFFAYPFFSFLSPDLQDDSGSELYLNNFEDYATGKGKVLNLSVGQIVYFGLGDHDNFERHSITIKEIGTNYIVITIASTPFDAKLYVGDKKQFDVTGDGKNNIEITLNSIVNNIANITFKQLSTTSKSIGKESSIQPGYKNNGYWQYWVIGGALFVILAFLAIKKHRLKQN